MHDEGYFKIVLINELKFEGSRQVEMNYLY